MSALALEAENLTRVFKDTTAVRDLNLSIAQGEMFALVGPDGAGKTTTLKLLSGVLEPTSGTLSILGRDRRKERASINPLIGYLSQRFSLYEDLSVDENLEFFAEIHGIRGFSAQRERLLDFTRLKAFRSRLAGRLSGGMKQKLSLSCILIHTPRIIFLDEPTTGVDPVSRREFWIILSTLLDSGITIIMATPYLDEAERCTRVGLMNNGRLIIADTPAGIKARMKGRVVELVCDTPRNAFQALRSAPSFSDVQAFGDRLRLVVEDDTRSSLGSGEKSLDAIRDTIEDLGIRVQGLRFTAPTLEHVFISILKSERGEP